LKEITGTLSLVFALWPVYAGLCDISYQASIDLSGRYVWRGQDISDRPVLQPAFELTLGQFAAGLWGNMDLTHTNDRCGDFSELDYYASYSGSLADLAGLEYELGLIVYDFHGRWADGSCTFDTVEAYCSISLATFLNPTVCAYLDLDEADGLYVSLELSKALPLGFELSAGLGLATSSYNKYYWGVDSTLPNDITIRLGRPVTIGTWRKNPSLTYVTIPSAALRKTEVYNPDSDLFFLGLSIQKEF
jgi:hypothetical protein